MRSNLFSTFISFAETFIAEVIFHNPLKIPLNLLKLHLIWEFIPDTKDNAPVISNKVSPFIFTRLILQYRNFSIFA